MILLDRYQVVHCFRIMFFLLQRFHMECLKMVALGISGASVQHNQSNDQYSSGDSNSLAEKEKANEPE